MIRALASILVALAAFAAGAFAEAQTPSDFRLVVSSRPVHVAVDMDEMGVVVTADGAVYAKAFRAFDGGPEYGPFNGSFSDAEMAAIIRAVRDADFFAMDEEYGNYAVAGGDQATIAVRMDGRTHAVTMVNRPDEQFDSIVRAVNRALPEERRIYYNALAYPWIYSQLEESDQ